MLKLVWLFALENPWHRTGIEESCHVSITPLTPLLLVLIYTAHQQAYGANISFFL